MFLACLVSSASPMPLRAYTSTRVRYSQPPFEISGSDSAHLVLESDRL